jgi:transcriptional regulator with XRE-family HTH domain
MKTQASIELQAVLSKQGLSQAQGAALVEIDRARFWRFLKGQSFPTVKEAVTIEDVFDVGIRGWLQKGKVSNG